MEENMENIQKTEEGLTNEQVTKVEQVEAAVVTTDTPESVVEETVVAAPVKAIAPVAKAMSMEEAKPAVAETPVEAEEEEEEEEMSMAALMANQDAMADIRRGSIIKGVIVKISADEIYVDIMQKSEGILRSNEVENPEVGMEIDVMIVKSEDQNGNIVLSRSKARQKVAWDKIIEAHKATETVKATVLSRVKGGLEATFMGLKCFVPGSQISIRKEYNLEKFVGQEFEFRVMEFNRRRKNIVLSRKILLQEVQSVKMKEVFGHVEVGSNVVGTVKSITDYGVFIDIGGIDGLLHITDMSWGHISDPRDIIVLGAEIETVILSIDQEKHKISLGLKQLTPDPWDGIDQMFEKGMVYQGVVKNLTEFGVFVTLTDGIDGLVHVSDLSWTKKNPKPSDFVSANDPINVAVLEIDKDNRRISLGLKQVTSNPWDTIEENYAIGAIIEGVVKNLTDFGAFVELEDGIEGLIHISDLSWTRRVSHPSELLTEGESTRVQVLAVDKINHKISLGLKQTTENPWDTIDQKYTLNAIVKGKVVNIKKFGLFVELEEGIEGLVHVNDISWTERIGDPAERFNVDDELEVMVIEINQVEKKLALGIKQLQDNPWEDFLGDHPVGSTIEGTITHFTKFGAFIKVMDNVEGLLHVSDISWTKRIMDPAKVLEEGQVLDLMVLQVDVVNRKISLGLKQLQENPWDEMKENKSRGKLVSGTIKSITDFGAFVDLGNEMEGLVHISQLSEERVENIADVVKIGDEVKCKILEVDGEERKIRLSMKDAAVEGDISDIRDEFSGGNDSGNVSIADALGGQLADLKMKFNGGDEN